MGFATLADQAIREAALLTRTLDAMEATPSLVAWYYNHREERWRLLLAGAGFDTQLDAAGVAAHRTVTDALGKNDLGALEAAHCHLLRTSDPLAQAFLEHVRIEGPERAPRHLTATSWNGHYVQEAVVIRSLKPETQAATRV